MAYYADDWLTVYAGDCREVLPTLAADSVDCIVTSPPYWGLRDYGTATWVGGDEGCDHASGRFERPGLSAKQASNGGSAGDEAGYVCRKCGATRQDSQLGLEPTPEQYVANLVAVFRELRRVLKPSGTCWLNLGDSYAGGAGGRGDSGNPIDGKPTSRKHDGKRIPRNVESLKPKDLVGIPWRVAFALQQPYYTGHIKDEKDRVWLAALMDGEGTFTILSTTSPHGSGNSYPPIAQVRMTSQAVVQKAASLVGVMSPAQYPPSMKGKRGIYQWRLNGRRAADVAAELYPYLIEKRQQAMVVWNHQAVRDSYETKRGVTIPTAALEKQKVCRDLIRRLNRAEPIVVPSWMVEPPSLYEPGWYLRSDVIWSKPNPMPESVTDRPTKSHEYLFLLTKSARYYFDQEAVRETAIEGTDLGLLRGRSQDGPGADGSRVAWHAPSIGKRQAEGVDSHNGNPSGRRNIRSVWTIATRPYPGAHFAVFPPELPERCIKAGSSERGVCPACGAPWERVVERTTATPGQRPGYNRDSGARNDGDRAGSWTDMTVETTGWSSTCQRGDRGHPQYIETHELVPGPAVILDPFAGSGTVGMVAQKLNRRAILIDLNPAYVTQQMRRNAQTPLGLGA